MIRLRPAAERGHNKMDWLDTHYTFSFADYYDPEHSGFGDLLVINDDTIAPGRGFPRHGHRDMEIVTYVLEGQLQHKDSMGNGSIIVPGDVQRMSAGTGVLHSEYNASPTDPLHLLQIWILPEAEGIAPGYEQKRFSEEDKLNRLRVVASRDGREGSVVIHQDAAIYGSILERGARVEHRLAPGRQAWVHVARGSVDLNGHPLSAGDGAAISDEKELRFTGVERADVLVFDLAG